MPAYIDQHDALILDCGFGDLSFGTGAQTDEGPDDEFVVIYVPEKAGALIGSDCPEHTGKMTEEVQTVLRIRFHDIQSRDVLIRKLQKLKQFNPPCDKCKSTGRILCPPGAATPAIPCPVCKRLR